MVVFWIRNPLDDVLDIKQNGSNPIASTDLVLNRVCLLRPCPLTEDAVGTHCGGNRDMCVAVDAGHGAGFSLLIFGHVLYDTQGIDP